MKTLCVFATGIVMLALSSCGCNCNKHNPDLLKDYKPSSSKSFQ